MKQPADDLFECREVVMTTSSGVELRAGSITWLVANGALREVRELSLTGVGEDALYAEKLSKLPVDETSEERSVYEGVRLTRDDKLLEVKQLTVTSTTLRLDELSWMLQGESSPFASATLASLEGGDASREAATWRVEDLRYPPAYRRGLWRENKWKEHRGLLPPRASIHGNGVTKFVGEEAMVLPLSHRGQLFAGLWAAPFEEDEGMYGVSAGFASTSAPRGAWSGAPLRLDLGVATTSNQTDTNLRASLYGDAMVELRGEHQHIDAHLEEGSPELVTRSVRADDGGLRSWQQSRVGLALGAPETILLAGVVHDVKREDWLGRMLLGGSQPLDFLGLRAEYLIDHLSTVDDRRTHVHQSELAPGLSMHRGAVGRAYFKAHAGVGFVQTAYQDRDINGIDTAQSISSRGLIEAGASFEGRLTTRFRHRIAPRVEGFVSPVTWMRPRQGGVSQKDTKQSALSGLVTLDQALVLLNAPRTHETLSVELPASLLSTAQWIPEDDLPFISSTHLLLSPALRLQPSGPQGVSFGVTSWLCQGKTPQCRDGFLRQLGLELGKSGRWSVGYFTGEMNEELLAIKWLTSANMHAGALQANQWMDTLQGARRTFIAARQMHALQADLILDQFALGVFGYAFGQYRDNKPAMGATLRGRYTPASTGWSWEMVASIDDRNEAQWLGVSMSWSGR